MNPNQPIVPEPGAGDAGLGASLGGSPYAAAATEHANARAPAAPPKKGRMRRLIDFFWRGPQLTEARAELARRSDTEKRLLAYARATAELADRTLDPVDPLRASSALPVVVGLYREAFRAARAAQGASGALDTDGVAALSGQGLDVARARELLVAPDLHGEIAQGREIRREHARRLQLGVQELLQALALPEQRVRRVRVQRWLRVGSVLFVLGALIVGAVVAVTIALQPPNLLKGKPWRASSGASGFDTQTGRMDGVKVDIFFHTNEELKPWIEYDLGKPTRVSGIRVVNRGDCCADRAIPLIVEASDDRTTYKQVFRREEPFTTWSQSLPPFTARYVRLRVDKQTWLHLEKVELR